jgi:cytochrome P450
MTTSSISRSDIDLHAEAALLDPYPLYAELRSLGGALWMTRYDMWALPRFAEVRKALSDWETFSSAHGVTFNDRMNETLRGVTLHTDPPEHRKLRNVLKRPATATAVRELEPEVTAEAERLVDRLVAKGRFDAVTELAHHLPLTIVSRNVGLPEEGRQNMLAWGAASFDCFGPLREDRTLAAFPIVAEEIRYLQEQATRDRVVPGGWADRLFRAADSGEIPEAKCPVMLNDYVNPSLDTTISATSSAIKLFAEHPDQWDMVRADPQLVANAVNEVVRIESPLQFFTRYVTRDVEIDGTLLPAGSRAIMMYASANRDDRQWPDPDVFDVTRKGVGQHVGFGFGEHSCIGQALARLEMKALLGALAARVERFEIISEQRAVNNIIRGLGRLEVKVRPVNR